ncbi:MAG: hypothetical protein ACI3W7_08275 [Oscillospiraceae bacterium]
MKRVKSLICFLLISAMLCGLCACGVTEAEEPTIDAAETEVPAVEETAAPEEPEETPEPLSETTLAEMEIFDAIDYSEGNFLTEAEFYSILRQVLALHDLELTRYPGSNGYFYFNYSNLGGVRLLTVARDDEALQADIDAAWADYQAEVEEYAKKKEAAQNGETYEEPEEEEPEEEEEEPFDAAKDVENSQDYVISFVLSAADTEMDQQVMFLVSAVVWCILNPHYNNTDDAFAYLWRALYTTYAHSEGLSASTIDGIDSDRPFTIPGNATEAWLGTDDAGNYILAITNYAVYDEIIDINATAGANIPLDIFSTVG